MNPKITPKDLINEKQDYNPFARTNFHTKSVWCTFCYGSGYYRARSHSLDPHITIKLCQHCKGRRRIWIRAGTDMDKEAKQIIPGLWPNQSYKIHRK